LENILGNLTHTNNHNTMATSKNPDLTVYDASGKMRVFKTSGREVILTNQDWLGGDALEQQTGIGTVIIIDGLEPVERSKDVLFDAPVEAGSFDRVLSGIVVKLDVFFEVALQKTQDAIQLGPGTSVLLRFVGPQVEVLGLHLKS